MGGQETERDQGVTLAELLAAFSLATDLGLGQPMEHILRSWRVAARLAKQVELDDDERASLYYIAVLAWVGCVADTPEVAKWFGDDIAFRRDSYQVDLAGLPGTAFMLGHVGSGSRAFHRLRLAATLVATGGQGIQRGLLSHCLTTSTMAQKLGLGAQVCDPLMQFFTRWDGKGVPGGVGREDIAPALRLFHLAHVVAAFHRTDGVDAAVEVARARSGSQFDPAVVDAFCPIAPDVLDDGGDPADLYDLISADPGLQHRLSGGELDGALEVVADFTDLRSSWRAGHSRGVAELAGQAADLAGLPAAEVTAVQRAGLLHDIGMHGVPSTILDKPGALTATESERMRMHAYYTERVLARPVALARLGAIASLTHERLDGSGYHRGLSGAALRLPARILAAADAHRAMTEPRPYRPALTPKEAAAALREDVRAGRLATVAVDAVLTAAGERPRRRHTGPAGLTPREIQVLVLIARGASTRQVASALDISTKTAGTHIERTYAKTGVSSRATATLFALQHGLLDSFEPLDT
ncbi:MAG: LuxR C-terminal-related transcriptional regulator [Actinomycetota bacterium]|nr:LuxR C-terminal-related transcriptional regulator [Actinomycetota bacterium]